MDVDGHTVGFIRAGREREEKEEEEGSVCPGDGYVELFGRFLRGYRGRVFFGTRGERRLRQAEFRRFRRLTHLPVETATVPESSCIYPADPIERMTERVLPRSAYPNTSQHCVINDNAIGACPHPHRLITVQCLSTD